MRSRNRYLYYPDPERHRNQENKASNWEDIPDSGKYGVLLKENWTSVNRTRCEKGGCLADAAGRVNETADARVGGADQTAVVFHCAEHRHGQVLEGGA